MQEFCPCLVSCKPLINDFNHLKEVKLTTSCFSIGRGLNNILQIPYVAISRHHCKLTKTDCWRIEDNSTFGILVNNKRVGKGNVTNIHHGDTITLDPGNVFVYKFLCEDEGPTPNKRIKLDEDKEKLISEVKSKFEEFQNDEIKHIEDKIHNNKKLENKTILLVEQLKLKMVRKINVINNKLTAQVENLTGCNQEIEKQRVLLVKERDKQVAVVKQDMEQIIHKLEEQIKTYHEMEPTLIVEKEYYIKKMAKDKEEFMLNKDIVCDQGLVDLLYRRINEKDKRRVKEKTEMMQKLKKVTLQLRLEKEKELQELIDQKKVIENDLRSELIHTKQNIDERVELVERKKHEVQVQLNEQIAAMKKLEQKDKAVMDQLRYEKEEINRKMIESQKDAEKTIADLKAKVAAREEELAALTAETMQKQAEQSNEMISSLHDQLEKVTNELKSTEYEKQILLENTPSTSGECSKKLGEIGDLLENELQCSICAELFISPTTLNCSHSFCVYCITMWKKKKKDCPICRTPIKSECRSLALDSFIEKMVEKLSPEMKQKRQEMLKARKEIECNAVLQENTTTRRRYISEEEETEDEDFEFEEEEYFRDNEDSVPSSPTPSFEDFDELYSDSGSD